MIAAWTVAVDIGGTFTDLAAWRHESNEIKRAKVLTVPDEPVRGVIAAIEKAGIELRDTSMFLHGSTVAINAVLQGTGARTALLTTRGFRDVLEMGRKNRPDMYNLFFKAPPCPVAREDRFEVDERLSADGAVIKEIEEEELRAIVAALPAEIQAVAICFIHAYANPGHERRAADVVRDARPDVYTCISTELSGEAREYERTCTAVANAYVGPLVATYVAELAAYLERSGSSAPLLSEPWSPGPLPASPEPRGSAGPSSSTT